MIIKDNNGNAVFGKGSLGLIGVIAPSDSAADQFTTTKTSGSKIFIKVTNSGVDNAIVYIGTSDVSSTDGFAICENDGIVELPFGDASQLYGISNTGEQSTISFWVI